MFVEAEEIIRHHYDNLEGGHRLAILMKSSKKGSSENLLQMTNIDKKIKLRQMEKTWAFTRPM